MPNFERGQQFGKYLLLDRIAVGGMAEIFLAKQSGVEGFEKLIAIKRIRPHLSGHDNFVNMFLNEAKLAAQLTHPNIVQIYDLGRIGDAFFIAMEYVSGRDMSRVIPKCRALGIPYPYEYALKIASQVLEALYYAHNKSDAHGNAFGIVHRDVTPENILVGYAGQVKVADFGIAKASNLLEGNNRQETRVGEIKGKLSYMSPEQCMGKNVDHRSDVFSLGVVLYEWLTGFKLFSGDNDLAIINNIIEGKIYPPSYFKDSIPEVVETIVMKALEKDRKKRYQSAWDMQFDIDTFLASNEFTPSNIHLSNFMKQLFKEEIDREQDFVAARLQTPSRPYEVQQTSDVIELSDDAVALEESKGGEITTAQSTPVRLQPTVRLNLSEHDYGKLRTLAERKGVSVDSLASDALRSLLSLL